MAAKVMVPLEISMHMRMLHQEMGVPVNHIVKLYKNISKSTVYRHCKKGITTFRDLRVTNKGRPRKLTIREERKLIRKLFKLRKSERHFTAKRLRLSSGLMHVSHKTIQRTLNRHGFKYLQTRRKGRMSENDLKKRVKFARDIIQNYTSDIWTKKICFYLDGKSFQYKLNPCDQAKAPRAREWRRKNEGLNPDCIAKGSKVGSGGKVAHFMVAISYDRAAIVCDQYEKMNGKYFAGFVREKFRWMIENSVNPHGSYFLQDGDPSQNSKLAKTEIDKIGAVQISIPPRSPDINPIENFFNLIEQKLSADAISQKITSETFEEFSERVRKTILNYPVAHVNKIIESMNKRMKLIKQKGGKRLKY